MIWRAFRRAISPPDRDAAWWSDANAAAGAVTADAIAQLQSRLAQAPRSSDDLESQQEMIDGLEMLLAVASRPLPTVETQHRVIGADRCHLAVPATLGGDVDTPGKLFATSARLIFVGGGVHAWPWHRIRQVVRTERSVSVLVPGLGDAIQLTCNSFGDALVAVHIAGRVRQKPA